MWVPKLKPTPYKACERDTPQTPNLNKRKRDFYEKKTNRKQKTKRDIFLKIRVTEEELEAFRRKYKNSRCKSFSDFVRRCVFDGLILLIDKEKMQGLYSMLNSINNNVNQIKVRVTKNDDAYADDFKEIEERILEIWRILFFFQKLAPME